MAREIPEVVRAAAGLAATVLDETRRLPETLPGLPVRLLGLAMQASMKVQQHYAGLVARGDELFTGIRGESEPGLATFDEDEQAPAAAVHTSPFDRVAETIVEVTEEDEVVADGDEALAEIAIEELVDAAPAPSPEGADALENQLLDADRDADGLPEAEVLTASPTVSEGGEPADDAAAGAVTEVDVLAPDGTVETVEGTITDEGVAAAEAPAESAAAAETPAEGATATDEGGTPVAEATGDATDGATDETPAGEVTTSLEAPRTAPVEGYDDFSIAQLRGHLRGYAGSTVQGLLDYEQATQAREPYVRMLRNRLERLQADGA